MGLKPTDVEAMLQKPGMRKANQGITITAESLAKYPVEKAGNKFHVSKKEDRTTDGIVFDSKQEMLVYQWLKEAGIPMERQVTFVLQPRFELNGVKYRAIEYWADFKITVDGPGGPVVYVVDVKGMRLPDYKMKLKMMAYTHKIQIVEIKSRKQMKEFIASARLGHVTSQKILAPPK